MTDTKRRQYTAEFKQEAADLVIKQGYTIAEAARNLGIRSNMLSRWRQEQLKAPQNAFPGSGHQAAELEELNRLREENRKLKLEKEILKKAAVFFAKESG
jgi:transposase